MNVASLKLCEELYELSGWNDCTWGYFKTHDGSWVVHLIAQSKQPAYDLGYLMRKLPETYRPGQLIITHRSAQYVDFQSMKVYQEARANTAEDAACKLAIELFKQGVLSHDT